MAILARRPRQPFIRWVGSDSASSALAFCSCIAASTGDSSAQYYFLLYLDFVNRRFEMEAVAHPMAKAQGVPQVNVDPPGSHAGSQVGEAAPRGPDAAAEIPLSFMVPTQGEIDEMTEGGGKLSALMA